MSLGLYLHIPYCFSKCRYCDFYSHPGERGVPDAYVDALLRELARFAPDAPLRPDTVYFGGGTPSLLTPAYPDNGWHLQIRQRRQSDRRWPYFNGQRAANS